jgi:hypothetical protein
MKYILFLLLVSINALAESKDSKQAFSDRLHEKVSAYKKCSCGDRSDRCKGNFLCPSVDFKTLKRARIRSARNSTPFDAKSVQPLSAATATVK